MSFADKLKELATVDFFREGSKIDNFVGRPFSLDYERTNLLICDSWKTKVQGVPQGAFLLAFYDNENDTEIEEALLLRAIRPVKLPTDSDVISSMIEYYKDNLKTSGKETQLDDFTRYEFSFSGLECRILGTFYKEQGKGVLFGADVENFYSSHNYNVFKPQGKVLEFIANLQDGEDTLCTDINIKIGKVRYSSSMRFQKNIDDVPVYISPKDFLGKRTALFGMTRTGKSNTVKKIIEATVQISSKAKYKLDKHQDDIVNMLDPFERAIPKFPVGQIIFDINGEYANPNMQDEGTAIYELYQEDTIRYSVLEKPGFKVMKVNFYNDINAGYELIRSYLGNDTADYVRSFTSVDLIEPDDKNDQSAMIRYYRKVAVYMCCLKKAGFKVPAGFKVKFAGNKYLNELVQVEGRIDPSKGISLDDAVSWWSTIWDNYDNKFFTDYKRNKGHEWADEDLKALLVFLTRKTKPAGNATVNGYIKLRGIVNLHTDSAERPFEIEILENLRQGRIIIIDLSQGDPSIQALYSERICTKLFHASMQRFVENEPNNFIQFYFEEAHNLFPKKDDKDLSQIYNRLAKEGAKLNLGLAYATQEVSSISSNILKNTQNWFIAHLNNDDELKELKKFYDFEDFTESLIRFSASTDKGFVRMKTYSNPFVVPVQIDRFSVKDD